MAIIHENDAANCIYYIIIIVFIVLLYIRNLVPASILNGITVTS